MILYATKLRALAIIGVVLIHISARLVRQEVGTFEWWVGNIVDSGSRWAVPVFVMLSGLLLLGKKEDQSYVIKKRITRIIWPFLFWSFIYSIWNVRYELGTYSLRDFAINIYQDNIKYHFWYLYVILGLYLCLPLFKTLVQNGKKSDILYFIFISFFISAIATTLQSVYNIRIASGFEYFLGYGGYFLLGYYLTTTEVSQKSLRIFYLLGVAALFLTIAGTWFVSMKQGSLNQVFYGYLSMTTPFVAISIFLLVKNFSNKECSKLISLFAKYSFGIYLIHPLVLDIFRGNEFIQLTGISHLTVHPVFYVLFIFILAFSTSLFLSFIVNKIPFIRRFV